MRASPLALGWGLKCVANINFETQLNLELLWCDKQQVAQFIFSVRCHKPLQNKEGAGIHDGLSMQFLPPHCVFIPAEAKVELVATF